MSRQTSAGEASVTVMCKTFQVSRAAYYAARKPRTERTCNVVPLRRKPECTSAETALAAIREVLAEEKAWGVRKVWATLKRKGMVISRRRVWALMNAHGLVLARDREPGETTRGHVAVPEPNRRLATDLTTVWTKLDGVVAVALAIDCGCRSLLGLSVTKSQEAPDVLKPVADALCTAFGAPDQVPDGVELRSDHGPQYTGADCADLVDHWKLLHTFAPVGRPTGNAVVERVIRTMKEEVVWLQDWETAEELREALRSWLVRYNTSRPHQALGWRTPAEYRAEKLAGSALAVKAAA